MSKQKKLTEAELLELSEAEILKLPRSEKMSLPVSVLKKLSNEAFLQIPMAHIDKMPKSRQDQIGAIAKANFKKWWDQWKYERDNLRRQLTPDGDASFHRVLLEMSQETGLNVEQLGDMEVKEFNKFLRAAIRKREVSGPWVEFDRDQAGVHDSTLSRHVTDGKQSLERIGTGRYRCRQSDAHKYRLKN